MPPSGRKCRIKSFLLCWDLLIIDHHRSCLWRTQCVFWISSQVYWNQSHMILTGINSYSPKQYLPPSRTPSLGPGRRGTAGRWVCRRSRWSKSTAPASGASDQRVTASNCNNVPQDFPPLCLTYHLRVGAVVEFHGFLLHVPDGGVRAQRHGNEQDTWGDDTQCEIAHKMLQRRFGKKAVILVPVTLKLGATLLSASVNQMRPRLMQKAAETSARLYRLPGTQNDGETF